MNDYKFNKLLSDTITLPILPANKFTSTDTEYYAVLEKNYIPITSNITHIYKPDWITGYRFDKEGETPNTQYYNKLVITTIQDNTEKKLRKGIMEFVCTNNIPMDSSFISGINHIYAKVSQAPYEDVGVRLEFIPTEEQKTDGLISKEEWNDNKEHIIGGKISGNEQEIHIKYCGILNGINQSKVTLLINDKQLDTNNIKSSRTTLQNEIDLIYLIDENINVKDKTLKFSVIFKTTYNSKQRNYYITQGYNSYVIKLGIDSIDNTIADNILYQGETKKLIYSFSLNTVYKKSDDLVVHFEFIDNTYELTYQTGTTSYIDNQYNLTLNINSNYTLQERKVKVYVIYKNKIKSNEIIITQKYDTDMKLYYDIDDITYDTTSIFNVSPFGKNISLYYYAKTSDGHIVTSMSNIKYIDNIEITEYYEINYTRVNENLTNTNFDYNNIKDIDNELNDTKKLVQLQFPLLTEFINPKIYININLSTLKLNNITFIQQHFDRSKTKINLNTKQTTEKIGGIPQFSEIKLVFNAVNAYGDEESIETDSNLFNINFFQKNQDAYTPVNSLFDLDNIEYETTKYNNTDYLIAQNIRLKNEYYNASGNRTFYYQISYILGNTEIYRTDYTSITQESLQYDCKLTSDTNIISFEGNSNFIIKGYGILYNSQEEKNNGISSNAYYTTYLTSAVVDQSSDNILNSQIKLVNTSDYTNIKLDIKNIDNTNVNNNQRIRKLIIIGKYRYNTNSDESKDTLTLQQTYIKLNLELYSNNSLDEQLTYNNSTRDCYIIENILQDTVLYFKYYMQELIIENNGSKLVNVNLKEYNSDLTISLNNTNSLTVWTQNNLMPYTSNITYNEDEDYYYGILNIPQNLLTSDNKIILKYIQKYKDIDYAYTQFVLYKDRVDTLYDDDKVYRSNNDLYAYISHYRITGDGIATIANNSIPIVQYKIDTTIVTDFIIYYNVIYKYIDNMLIDTTLNNFYKGISLLSSHTPYYEKSEQFIEKKGKYNYIGQKITMLENINSINQSYLFKINYKNNYKVSNIRYIQLVQISATRAYNLSYLTDDPDNPKFDEDSQQIYGVNHKDVNGKFKQITDYSIYCDSLEQTLDLYIGLYCNKHVDKEYKQPFKTGEIDGDTIEVTADMFNLSENDKKYISITDPIYDNNGYYKFTATLSDITSEVANTSVTLKYSRKYANYNYNNNKFESSSTKISNILKIVRIAYNKDNYSLYIGFYDKNGNEISEISNTYKDKIYIHYYLTKANDENKLDLSKIKYDFTLKLGDEDISIDVSRITNNENVYSYPYTISDNIAESQRNLVATVSINESLKNSTTLNQKGTNYSIIIRDNPDFDGYDFTDKYKVNGKKITQTLYFKGGPNGSFDDDLSHYNITCDDTNVILSGKERGDEYHKVTVTIHENDSTTAYKLYRIKVTYQYSSITKDYSAYFTIQQGKSNINAYINLTNGAPDDKINNAGETIQLQCYGQLNGDDKAVGVLTCSDPSITIPEATISGNRLIYNIDIGISSTDRTLKFTFTYTFHDSQATASKTLSQESGKFTLYIFAYYRDKEDNEELKLLSSDNGSFYIRYYAQYENGMSDTVNLDKYTLSYEKYVDDEQNTYEYLKNLSLSKEKQLNTKTDIIYDIDDNGQQIEIKKENIKGIENSYNFSKNESDENESSDKAVKFTVKYMDITSSVIVFQDAQTSTMLAPFDYLIFHYKLNQQNSAEISGITSDDKNISRNNGAGQDMDTITRITNNKNFKMEILNDNDSSIIVNNTTAGFGCVVNGYEISGYTSFLRFSGDNMSSTGEESVFIYVKKIVNQITTNYPKLLKSCRYLYFDLFGHWFNTMKNGKVNIVYETYNVSNGTPNISKDKYVISSNDPKANDPVSIDAYIYIQTTNKSYETLMARLEYDIKNNNVTLKPMSEWGYQLSTNNDVLIANIINPDNPNAIYVGNFYQILGSNYQSEITIKELTLEKSEISNSSIEVFDFSTYYYSLITEKTWRIWRYFNKFIIKESDRQGLIFNIQNKKVLLNAKQTYSSISWPSSADNTRTIVVTSDPEIPGFTFNIKIIEKYSK